MKAIYNASRATDCYGQEGLFPGGRGGGVGEGGGGGWGAGGGGGGGGVWGKAGGAAIFLGRMMIDNTLVSICKGFVVLEWEACNASRFAVSLHHQKLMQVALHWFHCFHCRAHG